MEIITAQKPKKTFSDYYSNPEYRKKHKEYLMQSVKCTCGCTYIRSNASHHKSTQKHKMIVALIEQHKLSTN